MGTSRHGQQKARIKGREMIGCAKHPNYQGKQQPARRGAECAGCWLAWVVVETQHQNDRIVKLHEEFYRLKDRIL